MRLYSFINFYLSSIQQGIQTAHLVHEMMLKYDLKEPETKASSDQKMLVRTWAEQHKTIIILNGGPMPAIINAQYILKESGYPYCSFYEDAGLGNILTGVAVVLPETVYGPPIPYQYHNDWSPNRDWDVHQLIKSKRLAS